MKAPSIMQLASTAALLVPNFSANAFQFGFVKKMVAACPPVQALPDSPQSNMRGNTGVNRYIQIKQMGERLGESAEAQRNQTSVLRDILEGSPVAWSGRPGLEVNDRSSDGESESSLIWDAMASRGETS